MPDHPSRDSHGPSQAQVSSALPTVMVNGVPHQVYRSVSRGKVEYEVKYREANGQRRKVSTRHFNEISGLGRRAEEAIEASKRPRKELWGREASDYLRAIQLAKKLGMDLLRIVQLVVDCVAILGGHDLRRAVQFYVDKGMLRCKRATFQEFVEVYLRKEYGSPRSKLASDDIARSIGKWVQKHAPGSQFVDVPVEVLKAWVYAPEAKRYWTKCTRRKRLITMYNYARDEGFWPIGEPTTASRIRPVTKKREDFAPPEIFAPGALQKVIYRFWEMRHVSGEHENALYSVLFGAFLGIRLVERSRVTWEDVDLDAGYIRIPVSAAKDLRERGILIPPNLLAFLRMAGGRRTGPLLDEGWLTAAGTIAREWGFEWPCNGLRHSFATAWNLIVNKPCTLARLLGNSARELRRSYLGKATIEWATAHFNIYPPGFNAPRISGEELKRVLEKMVPPGVIRAMQKRALEEISFPIVVDSISELVPDLRPGAISIPAKEVPLLALLPEVATTVAPSLSDCSLSTAESEKLRANFKDDLFHVQPTPSAADVVLTGSLPALGSPAGNTPAESLSASGDSALESTSLVVQKAVFSATPRKPKVPNYMVKQAKRQAHRAWMKSEMQRRGERMPKNAWQMYVDWTKYSRR